ncbi:TetR/AcrR family transcriptional regulator [Desmospora activa]|uniref:TetR family transcriptional regulator n=1 Tax=Desmospora activa DSM 45169 TaxID=1121389 RepID=A0A2T4ZD00_9BACL|nr:TetR/AcrR family transcriptional regulator [Desmospora activa]PTM59769.1 TetR family transcriptional regulator [Desmospora activa DSM 45169]
MVKGFSEREKEIIRNKLMEVGRERFGSQGLKKTSIRELTDAVGIAQGSFYLFFHSKEELFFRILEIEEASIQQKLQSTTLEPVTAESFKQWILKALTLAENNPIVRRLYVDGEYELMLRKLQQEVIEQHIQKDADALLPLISSWQQQGLILAKKPEMIASVIRSLFLLTLHKKEIGEDIYDETIDLIVELIASGLVTKKGKA